MYNLLIYKFEKPQKLQQISKGLKPKTLISANPAYNYKKLGKLHINYKKAIYINKYKLLIKNIYIYIQACIFVILKTFLKNLKYKYDGIIEID